MLSIGLAAMLGSATLPAAPPEAPPAAVGLVDRVLCRDALDAGRPSAARAWLPSVATGQTSDAAAADAVTEALTRGEGLLTDKSWTPALVAFRQALVAQPGSARALWGISRAADGAGLRALGRQAALRVVRGAAVDRSVEIAAAAAWRVEQPE